MEFDDRIIAGAEQEADGWQYSLRPRLLNEYIGQTQVKDNLSIFIKAAAARHEALDHVLLFGPPGLGKTTLANIIANELNVNIRVTSGPAIERQGDLAAILTNLGDNDVLFIDEIHRFNKTQQDTLLPHVEDGTLVLIGATTENPYFEVNRALVSRSVIFSLEPLRQKDIASLLRRALADEEKGLGCYHAKMDEDALDFLSNTANGDARAALNALELAVLTTDPDDDGMIHITLSVAEDCIQRRALQYDKGGDNHYDTISAFIKSMRGSDPDAALYYLAKMIYAGEDPKFIARRVVICAAEDVGNADPHALQVAVSAMQAVNFIGMPEGRIPLAQAVTYVSCAPKSNAAYLGIDKALADVRNVQIKGVPPHLRDGHYSGSHDLGNAIGYKYAHDYPNHYVEQQYLPDELVGTVYYDMSNNGVERRMKEHMKRLKGEL